MTDEEWVNQTFGWGFTPSQRGTILAGVRGLIAAERGQCAEVAATHLDSPPEDADDQRIADYCLGWNEAVAAIAAAISSGRPPYPMGDDKRASRVRAVLNPNRDRPPPAWSDEMPSRRGWWVYRDARGCWLCFCENDEGGELTWRGEIPPGEWGGQWCGPLEPATEAGPGQAIGTSG